MSLDTLSLENEIWKPIPEWEQYLASSHGRIYSLKSKRLLKLSLNRLGYFACGLCDKQKKQTFRVHRLIIMAFKGKSDLTVDHIDGNKTNNHIDNLEYVTQQENINRYYKSDKYLKSNKYSFKKNSKGYYRDYNRFVVQIWVNGKNKAMGRFSTEIEAAEFYKKCVDLKHADKLNNPPLSKETK